MPAAKNKSTRTTSNPKPVVDDMVALHRSSFIQCQPSPIISMSSSSDGSLLAAARENGDIELYDALIAHQILRIPGFDDAAPTSIVLLDSHKSQQGPNSRLFSAGLDGSIVEYDLETLTMSAGADSHGGAVWQLACRPPVVERKEDGDDKEKEGASDSDDDDAKDSGNDNNNNKGIAVEQPATIAAACDDGAVRLFTVENTIAGVTFSKSLPRVEGRCLAIAWHPQGSVLASAGTDKCIHIWHPETNRELLRLTAGDGSGREFCVWSLLYLPDGTLVSGDSTGNVCFWDGVNGTLMAKFNKHSADVLTLAASPNGNVVFASGVDSSIAVFHKVHNTPTPTTPNNNNSSSRSGNVQQHSWVYLSSKRTHSHDVRSLCCLAPSPHHRQQQQSGGNDGSLWSAGNDAMIYKHSVAHFLKKHPTQVDDTFPQRPFLQRTMKTAALPMLCAMQKSELDIWQLGPSSFSSPSSSLLKPDKSAAIHAPITPSVGIKEEGMRADTDRSSSSSSAPVHLARIINNCSTGNGNGAYFVTAAVSPSGNYLAVSDVNRVRCFALAKVDLSRVDGDGDGGGGDDDIHEHEDDDDKGEEEGGPSLLGVRPLQLPSDLPPAAHLAFISSSEEGGEETLVMCTHTGIIHTLKPSNNKDDDEDEPTIVAMDQTIKEIHNLRYKLWAKRDRGSNAGRHAAPTVEKLTVSPDGRWLAVATRQRVVLLNLSTHTITAQFTPTITGSGSGSGVVAAGGDANTQHQQQHQAAPATALAFTSDSKTLIAIDALKRVAMYDVLAGQPTPWSTENLPALTLKLSSVLPGRVVGISSRPGKPESLVLYGTSGLIHLDLSQQLTDGNIHLDHDNNNAGGGDEGRTHSHSGGKGQGKRKRGRDNPVQPHLKSNTRGGNGRYVAWSGSAVVFVDFLSDKDVLLVEKPWEEVWRGVAPPLFRKRYGH